jgi:hypothetical protein
MAGIKGNKKHANKTSYPHQKNNKKHPAVVLRKFSELVKNAKEDNDILCWQDACMSINWRDSKVNYWCGKIPIFANLKKDVQNIIIARVNKNALKNKFNATASIWRMKQLGEVERSEQTIKQDTGLTINVNSKEEADDINEMLDNID